MLRMGHRSHARREVFGHLRCALLIVDGASQDHLKKLLVAFGCKVAKEGWDKIPNPCLHE